MFDLLPLDIIKYEILPFAANDYFARMGINSMLQPAERVSTPLRKNAAAEFEMSITVLNYRKNINDEYALSASERAKSLMNIFDFLNKNPTLLKYDINYRNATIKKVEEYSDPNFSQYRWISEDEKMEVVSKANKLAETLSENKYVCEVRKSVSNEAWSPIDGLKTRIINNFALLEKIERELRAVPRWRLVEHERNSKSYGRQRRHEDLPDEYYTYEKWEYGYFDMNDQWVFIHDRSDDSE